MIHRGDSESVLFNAVAIYRDRCPNLFRTQLGVARHGFTGCGIFGSEGRFGSPSRTRGPFPLPLFIIRPIMNVFAILTKVAFTVGEIFAGFGGPFLIVLTLVVVIIVFLIIIVVRKCWGTIWMMVFGAFAGGRSRRVRIVALTTCWGRWRPILLFWLGFGCSFERWDLIVFVPAGLTVVLTTFC